MILYFTGTGNSFDVAKIINSSLNDEMVSLNKLLKENKTDSLKSSSPFVFVVPIYASRIPHVISDFIRHVSFEGNKEVYFIVTYGGLEGPCGHYVKKLLKQKGLVLKGYDKVKMPDNYIVAFFAPTQEEIEKLLKAGHLKAERIGQAILKGEKFYHSGHFAYLLTSYENSSFVKYAVSPQEFSVNEDCIKCGKCAANCPMNNISLSDQGPKWGNKCCLCLACLNLCPKRAIDYGKKTKKRGRYVNPNYRAD